MKRRWTKKVGLLVAILFEVFFISFAGMNVRAEEGDENVDVSQANESEVLGASYKVGDNIKFGHYEQDGISANGKEDIEWQVLKVEPNRVLVISKYALDCKPFNTERTTVTWETCSLRKWLNNDFLDAAFTTEEQAIIPIVSIENKNNPKCGTAGGNNTNDQIFCLSLEEMESYFGSYSWYDSNSMYGMNQNLICTPTKYAENNGAYAYTITESDYNNYYKNYGYTRDVIGRCGAHWWLRSPGRYGNDACDVDNVGDAGAIYSSYVNHSRVAVRPALFLNTSSVEPISIELDMTSATMYYGNEMTLTATLDPSNVTEKTITWTSSNPAVATVSTGIVKAKTAGKTTITAKTINGLTATCDITVFADNVSGNIFADIKADSWMYTPAKSVYDKGYMTGTGTMDGRVLFSPNTDMNRTMFVQALYSMEGKPEVTYEQKFEDVKESAWYAKAVTWASNSGVVVGNPDGTFGVNGKATREQMALMLYKYALYKNYDVSIKESTNLDGFNDEGKVSNWALTAVKWAVERGIISGKGNDKTGYRIAPTEKASRIECAAMLNKFSEVYAGDLKLEIEDMEEPLALPEEEIEDVPITGEEITDETIDAEEDTSMEDGDAVPVDEDRLL